MTKVPYRITKKAVEDLEEIWNYTFSKWSPEQADRYYKLMINEIEFVATNFNSGRSMGHIKVGYRASLMKSHLIFYREGEDRVVEIIRVLHQSMDVDNRATEK
jgi:toxin ParE1/3/4